MTPDPVPPKPLDADARRLYADDVARRAEAKILKAMTPDPVPVPPLEQDDEKTLTRIVGTGDSTVLQSSASAGKGPSATTEPER
jgi:hypothetical protein